MPIWAVAYLTLLFGITVWSVITDRRDGIPIWRLALDIAAMLSLGGLFAAYYRPSLIAAVGRGAALLLLAALVVLAVGAHLEIQRIEPDPELSPRQNLVAEHLGIVLGVVFISPAIAFGTLAAARAW